MNPPASDPRAVRFGVFELDLRTGELRRKGVKVALQEQPFEVLAMLVAQPGELVTREALRRALWPESVFVGFDHGLNKAVGKIRDALGDLAESPRYVETLERRGYRFIAPAEPVASRTEPPPPEPGEGIVARLCWNGQSLPLAQGEHIIGRDLAAAIWLESPTVSRHHARLVVTASAVTVEDLGSRNGTSVNGRPADTRVLLVSGDEIMVGQTRLVVYLSPTFDTTG